MNLEQLLAELTNLVERMEDEDLPIDKSTELFQKGLDISAKCFELLSASNGKLMILKERMDKYEDKD
ncbi:MAG: exodeoxyribonuclease VII small subunit [Clostridia bacterium]|nr:exodeoxyribonuclease VII small subunit [Clostridia bacterium]